MVKHCGTEASTHINIFDKKQTKKKTSRVCLSWLQTWYESVTSLLSWWMLVYISESLRGCQKCKHKVKVSRNLTAFRNMLISRACSTKVSKIGWLTGNKLCHSSEVTSPKVRVTSGAQFPRTLEGQSPFHFPLPLWWVVLNLCYTLVRRCITDLCLLPHGLFLCVMWQFPLYMWEHKSYSARARPNGLKAHKVPHSTQCHHTRSWSSELHRCFRRTTQPVIRSKTCSSK